MATIVKKDPKSGIKWAQHEDPVTKQITTELFLLSTDGSSGEFDRDRVHDKVEYSVYVDNLADLFDKLALAKTALGRQDFDVITILGHGRSGMIRVGVDVPAGTGQISSGSHAAAQFAAHFVGLKPNGQMRLLGCWFAKHFNPTPAVEFDGEGLTRQIATAIQRTVFAAATALDAGDFDGDGLIPGRPNWVYIAEPNGSGRSILR